MIYKPEFEVKSVLIVDDDKSNLDVLNHILKQSYTVFAAKSGKAAIKRAIEEKPDIILLDVIMPDMDGFEVLETLKKNQETQDIPVIFLTGLDDAESEEKGFFLGAVDYITKPFHASVVKARLRTHLQIVRQMRTIEWLCSIDPLTEIPNRRCFDERMNLEWSTAMRDKTPISLFMVDIDRFKNYNDVYGYPQGDFMLQTMAKVFRTVLRREEDMVARIGGEEFVCLLPSTDSAAAMEIAESMRVAVEASRVPLLDDDTILTKVTVSIGVCTMIPMYGITATEMVKTADTAVYSAKQMGRNLIVKA